MLSGIRKLASKFGSRDLQSVGGNVGGTHYTGGQKNGNSFFLSYPLKRGTNEDSLLIQSVKYKPPKKGLGFSLSGGGADGVQNAEYYGALQGRKVQFNTKTSKWEMAMGKDGVLSEADKSKILDKGFDRSTVGNLSGQETSDRYGQHSNKKYTGGQDTETNFYVELPIPKQVNDGNAVTWNANSMNMFTLAGLDFAQGLMNKPGETLNKSQELLNNMIGSANLEGIGTDSQTIQNTIRASIAGVAINQFGANVTPNTVMSRALGKILNSNKELLFDGVTLREFKFDFTFTPRSYDEGLRAKQIIRQLKKSMAPKSGRSESANRGLYLSSPDLFLLRYLSGGEDHPFLNSFKACALTNFSVNYTGAGTYATYGAGQSDSTPVHMKVSMVFKETNPIYDEDYDENVSGVGF
tara:strand:- start:98 stop:1324 length:1227 start_codon:yes stop_codon:yes gene_type:complete